MRQGGAGEAGWGAGGVGWGGGGVNAPPSPGPKPRGRPWGSGRVRACRAHWALPRGQSREHYMGKDLQGVTGTETLTDSEAFERAAAASGRPDGNTNRVHLELKGGCFGRKYEDDVCFFYIHIYIEMDCRLDVIDPTS